jgi:hypothetical protein
VAILRLGLGDRTSTGASGIILAPSNASGLNATEQDVIGQWTVDGDLIFLSLHDRCQRCRLQGENPQKSRRDETLWAFPFLPNS